MRAGLAAAKKMKTYGAKKDANHNEIVDAFKKLGAPVMDLSSMGGGVPDLIVECQGVLHLVDVKNPKTGYGKRGLNKLQKKWAEQWNGGPVYLVYTLQDVENLVNGRCNKVKAYGGYYQVGVA